MPVIEYVQGGCSSVWSLRDEIIRMLIGSESAWRVEA
jgi:hypothetical protein